MAASTPFTKKAEAEDVTQPATFQALSSVLVLEKRASGAKEAIGLELQWIEEGNCRSTKVKSTYKGQGYTSRDRTRFDFSGVIKSTAVDQAVKIGKRLGRFNVGKFW
ncbi:hypothetical protein OK016_29075 [Vibrio chagasii]|nr:hypothetical protein [Vibrio chagasii]